MLEEIGPLCAEVLRQPEDKLKLEQSFAGHGGDSLLAIRLVGRCREKGYSLTIRDVLQATTIRLLCDSAKPLKAKGEKSKKQARRNTEANHPTPVSSTIPEACLKQGVDDAFACSPIQEAFLVAQAMDPCLYQCTFVVRIHTASEQRPLNSTRLQAAWTKIVERHAALRTTFLESPSREGHFDQIVMSRGLSSLEVVPEREYSDVVNASVRNYSRHPIIFDGSQKTHRAVWCQTSSSSGILRLEISHAVTDGQSGQIILRDICLAYDDSDHLPETPLLSYKDFVAYQQRLPPSPTVGYWSRYLSGAEPSFFPVKAGNPDPERLTTLRSSLQIPGVAAFCERLDVTFANLCQVAWAIVLRAYTGSDDISFTNMLSGRHLPLEGIENTVGPFIYPVICRVKVPELMEIRDALALTKSASLDSLANQPPEWRSKEFARLRGNTLISCQRRDGGPQNSELGFELVDEMNPSEFDLVLNIGTRSDGLELAIDFWQSRVDQITVETVTAAFEQATLGLMNNELKSLGQVTVVPPADIEQIRDWNKTIPSRVEACLQDGVYEQRCLRPDALAVQGWDGDLTYQQLDDTANKLASYLVNQGVQLETKVPLFFEKSKWAVISHLAVLKAGGCVIPLGLNQPSARIQKLIDDTCPPLVLTTADLASRLSFLSQVVIVDEPLISALPDTGPPPSVATPDSTAYILYTSGSTGIPKGVVLSHGGLCSSLSHLEDKFDVGPHTRTVQFSGYTFDASIQDLFSTWRSGGCLCIIPEAGRLTNLGATMEAYKVNLATLTATLASFVEPAEVPSLKTLVLVGEPVQPPVVNRWIGLVRLFNGYGPSECSIISTYREIMPECDLRNIGHRMAGVLWVVEALNHNRLVPIGAPGELLIEGPSQGRGYFNDAERTAAAFVHDPQWVETHGFTAGRRLYRTGDLVQQNPDSSLTYIGRRDIQVKIHGQRVEIGEIEHHLHNMDSILDVAVLYPREGPCAQRLVTILTLQGATGQSSEIEPLSSVALSKANPVVSTIRESLANSVPEYMMPAVWIPVTSRLPQTDSGKLDRRALTNWIEQIDQRCLDEVLRVDQKTGHVQHPRTNLEKTIRDAWTKALNLADDQISVEGYSFLAAGGDSMLAMKVMALLRPAKVSLSMRDVLESRSISQLALKVGEGEVSRDSKKEDSEVETKSSRELPADLLSSAGINPDQVEDIYPCSPIQEGILTSQIKAPDTYYGHQSFEIMLPSATVDVERFINSWQTLVDRHAILRTVFVVVPQQQKSEALFLQVVLKSCKARVEHKACADADVASYLEQNTGGSSHVFEGELDYMLKVYTAPSGRVFAHIAANHALLDASSIALIQKDWARTYNMDLSTAVAPSYGSYISFLQQRPAEESIQYWSQRLSGAQPCFFPHLSPGVSNLTNARPIIEEVSTTLDEMDALRSFSQTYGVTLANIMQVAWGLVLSEFTGSSEVSFGYLSSGRDVPVAGIDQMVGPMINMMVSHLQLDPQVGVKDVIRQAQQDFFESFDHQRVPLRQIWHNLKLKGDGLFNTAVSYRPAIDQQPDNVNLAFQHVGGNDPSDYDITVHVSVSQSEVVLSLQYSSHFMAGDMATRLVECLGHTVRTLATNPELPIGEIQVVTPNDVSQICAWNQKAPRPHLDQCIPELVQRQRLLRPDATAVRGWDCHLTYQELDDLSGRLAYHLRTAYNIKPETSVAMCFDKSSFAVIAQLGVLKAGGVVVPVNPKHPIQRIEGLLGDMQARLLLTMPHYIDRFTGLVDVLQVDGGLLNNLPGGIEQETKGVLSPNNAAFIIYTSGSTGKPKGVVLTHGALCASLEAQGKAFRTDCHTRSLQFSSYTFDFSITDIWVTICHGGCVCVISEADRMNNLQGVIDSYQVNSANLTPTVADLLDLSRLPSLKTMVVGGEPLTTGVLVSLLKHSRQRKLVLAYGPSECTVITTATDPITDSTQASNIGRPILGGVWLVGHRGNLCPIGAVGELWIEGPLVSRGYLGDPIKTAESFIVDPSWARNVPGLEGRRFYRTGDLGRHTSDGQIIFEGRRDTQVKIRGQRVEIGEIEYQVKQRLTKAKAVVACLIQSSSGGRGPILAVVIQFDQSRWPSPNRHSKHGVLRPIDSDLREEFVQLHHSLTESLPAYMVPQLFVPAVQLPRTDSAKLDRKSIRGLLTALPEDELFQYSLSDAMHIAPATDTERQLQTIWSKALGLDKHQIGANDHFLHAGGDSVSAMRLVTVAQELGMRLTVFDVFRHPVLREMASHVDRRKSPLKPVQDISRFTLWKEMDDASKDQPSTLAGRLGEIASQCYITPEEIEDVYPATPLQEGLMATTAQHPDAYVGRWVYHLNDGIDIQRLRWSWAQLAKISSILRTRLVPGEGSGALQVVVRDAIECEESDNLDAYLAPDSKPQFGYGLPLMRASIATSGTGANYFVLKAHHSAYDGTSLQKTIDALSRVYTGQEVPAIPPYTRFIQYLEQQDRNAAQEFWTSQLQADTGAPFPALQGQLDQEGPSQIMTCSLPCPKRAGPTTEGTLLRAAWGLVLSSYTGGDVLFGEVLSGRTVPVPGVLDMLAPTITTVPRAIRVTKAQTVRKYLAAVQQQTVDMMPFEHTGLQHIRRIVQKAIDIPHLFTILPAEERDDGSDKTALGFEASIDDTQFFHNSPLVVRCITPVGGGSTIQVEAKFDEQVISIPLAQRLLDRMRHIHNQLLEIAATPGTADGNVLVKDIQMISPEEVGQLARWNESTSEVQPVLMHDLVHAHVLNQPHAAAVCSWDGDLTRAELDHLAETLAQHLVTLGVGPEVMVGFCFDKSKWAIVSMLAILKAGGAMVPIPSEQTRRRQAIIDERHIQFILTTRRPSLQFSDTVPHVIPVDGAFMTQLTPHVLPLNTGVTPSNAAFIYHTSGTTGTPKGVVIDHGSMGTSMLAQGRHLHIDSTTRSYVFSKFTFDMALHDTMSTLVVGGCVCLPSEEEKLSNLAGAINRMNVNKVALTPRVLQTLQPEDVPGLRTVLVGGEAVQRDQLEPWLDVAHVVDMYGPTECSIISTFHNVTHDSEAGTIGRALEGTLWVVDENDSDCLLPIGAIGELLVGGPLLARGYLDDPEKTAAAFIEPPTWLIENGRHTGCQADRRLYRTGDLVRQGDDGSLTYIGRTDSQIKVRGQLVSIGEVEHHIKQHSSVVDGVVVYPRRGPSTERLVGIIVLQDFVLPPGPNIQLTKPEDRSHAMEQALSVRHSLLEGLPDYMAPDVWITLADMPHSTSYKADRPRLKSWLEAMDRDEFNQITRAPVDNTSEKPTHAREEQLQSLCSQVLRLPLDSVAMNQSFLNLGGDSISAIQLISQGASKYGMTLGIHDVIQSRSLAELAQKSGSKRKAILGTSIPSSSFELSPIQRWYFESLANQGLNVSGESRFNQSVTLVINSTIDVQVLYQAAESLVQKHPMLRARFHASPGGWTQSIASSARDQFQFASHAVQSVAEAEQVISTAERQLNLEDGPVFAVHLIRIASSGQDRLFLTAHHLVVDIVSWHIIIRDLEDRVLNPIDKAEARPSTSFPSWARLIEEHNQKYQASVDETPGIDLSGSDWDYWGLNVDQNTYGNSIAESSVLDERQTALLFREGFDPVNILIAAMYHSFHLAFPDRAVPIVLEEGHGRESWDDRIDVTDTVGWFTTLSPIQPTITSTDPIDIHQTTKDVRQRRPKHPMAILPWQQSSSVTSHRSPEVTFNYKGREQQSDHPQPEGLFSVDHANSPPGIGAAVKRPAIFSFEIAARNGQVHIDFHYPQSMHKQDDVQLWWKTYQSSLTGLLSNMVTLPVDGVQATENSSSAKYERFSALKPTQDGESVQRNLGPLLEAPGTIVDAAPVTEQQALFVIGALRKSRDSLQYLCMEGKGVPDVSRWTKTIHELVQRHEILRTAYVFRSGELLQLVLDNHTPEIAVVQANHTNQTLDEFKKDVVAQDLDSPFQLGQPFVKFYIITDSKAARHQILFRLTHAECDQIALSYFMETLRAVYNQTAVPEYTSFCHYMHRLLGQDQQASREYWHTLLQGSYMTSIASPSEGRRQLSARHIYHASKQVPVTQEPPRGITQAIIMQAAWALVLARNAATRDVVFGLVASGRYMDDPAIQRTTGCCVNSVPVRAVLDGTRTVFDLFEQLREQFLGRIPHETLGYRDILQGCKNVPQESTYFTSRLNHVKQRPQWNLKMGDTEYNISTSQPDIAHELPHISVTSIQGAGEVWLGMQYLEGIISPQLAESLLSDFCSVADSLLNGDWNMTLESLLSRDGSVPASKSDELPRSGEDADLFTLNGGDFLDAGYTAFSLQEKGYDVTVDDVLDHGGEPMLKN